MESALRMFLKDGYENVSVDDIIAATGTSKGTFYHYFSSKEEIIGEITRAEISLIQVWREEDRNHEVSLQGHINRVFVTIALYLEPRKNLVRSLVALGLQEGIIRDLELKKRRHLISSISEKLGNREQAETLADSFAGTVLEWCRGPDQPLLPRVKRQLAYTWPGLCTEDVWSTFQLEPVSKEEANMKVAIIGGGLAGLTAAAYLSEHKGIEGVLFERSPQLGGRAFTYEKAGFTLNYGAHAIYGIDRHTITPLEKELNLAIPSKQVDKRKVMYAKHGQLTPAPLDFINIMKTDLLKTMQKVKFVGEVAAIIVHIHQLKNYATLGDYLAESEADEDVKELWEHLVCSNFFITPEEARKVPGAVISEYYHNLFLSSKPVNYILGSWAIITNQLQEKITQSGRWNIRLKEGIDEIRYEQRQYILKTKKGEQTFDKIVFAMPVQQVVKLLKGTAWEPFLAPYETNTATEVMVYDLGFKHVVNRPFHYISDMDNKMFITDVSATDHTLVPEGGQLLQGIAYLNDHFDSEEERKAYLERKTRQMEHLFDTYYPGWREATEVKRVSKKAMVTSVKNIDSNELLPNRIENVPFYFCGDGCSGKGELAERAFSSARQVAKFILNEVKELHAVHV
ncbi:FAD-dependent oxidoreductase [Paenibacillus larvae]